MSKVIVDITMSLDGFIAGPNIRPAEPMGDDGERLHDWMFGDQSSSESEAIKAEFFDNIGAYIMGGLTFELGQEPWGENPPYHAPCFVLSHTPRETITKQGGTSYNFVNDGIESALQQARAAAGSKDVLVMGGANAIQQFLNAGLVDELHLHVAHLLLGNGTRLFDKLTIKATELEKISTTDTQGVTHLKFRIPK
jgi:dihydrofolate reductase